MVGLIAVPKHLGPELDNIPAQWLYSNRTWWAFQERFKLNDRFSGCEDEPQYVGPQQAIALGRKATRLLERIAQGKLTIQQEPESGLVDWPDMVEPLRQFASLCRFGVGFWVR